MRKAPIGYCWILFNDSHSWHGIFRRGIFHRTNVQSRQRCLSRRAAMETIFVCCGFRPFRPGREHFRETARQSLCRNRVAKSGIGVKAAIFEFELGFSRELCEMTVHARPLKSDLLFGHPGILLCLANFGTAELREASGMSSFDSCTASVSGQFKSRSRFRQIFQSHAPYDLAESPGSSG